MEANTEYIKELLQKKGWSQNALAMRAGVSGAAISRLLRGKRGLSRVMMEGLLHAFPKEPMEKLFFLPCVLPSSNTIQGANKAEK